MKMLVAVDFESEPTGLVTVAAAWARRCGGMLHLRNVSQAFWGAEQLLNAEQYPPLAKAMSQQLDTERSKLVDLLQQIPQAQRGTAQVVRGQATAALAELSESFDITVVGTHGRRGIQRMFLGSVAEHLVRFAAGPALVLRLESSPLPADRPIRVVVPIDPHQPSHLPFERVKEFLGDSQAVVVLGVLRPLWVTPSGARVTAENHPERLSDEGRLAGVVAAAGLPVSRVELRLSKGDNAGGTVVDFAKEIDADLIVMPTHGRTGLKRLMFGSVAERVVRTAHCGVLVAR